ncbi:MAG: DUF6817 domain-containing protein [Actinocatenispora sp.]
MAKSQTRIEELLRSLGADRVDHTGGSLYDHLRRVGAVLGAWGADSAVRAAGMCHAAYGTDGFDHALLDLADRSRLLGVVGPRAEAIVYLYGSCDRSAVYPQIGQGGPVEFRDRFTGEVHRPDEADLCAFMEITAANELDVMAHDPAIAARHGAGLHRLFERARDLLSPAAQDACAAAAPEGP